MPDHVRFGPMILVASLCLWPSCRPGAIKTTSQHPADKTEIIEQRWANGALRLRRQVLSDPDGAPVDHGTCTWWHDNGRKEYEATYVRGRKHGTATRWHKNGQKWIEEHYARGRKQGLRCIWDQSGAKRKEEHYVKGKPHGIWMAWDKNGKIKSRQEFDPPSPRP